MSTATVELDESHLALDEFAAAWAAHERSAARLALAVARFDARNDYRHDGSVTMTAWLRHHCRMSDRDAGTLVRRGRFLHRHDRVACAAVTSALSAGQIGAIQAAVTAVTEPVFVAQDRSLVDHVAALDVRYTQVACRIWRQHAEAIADLPEPSVPDRELSFTRADDGTMLGRFVFEPALAAEFERAIGTASTWDGEHDQRAPQTRRADALFDIVAFFNRNHDHPGTPRHRPHIEITIDADDLHRARCHASTVDGDRLAASSVDAYLCDTWMQRITTSGSIPLDIGRATRTVPLDLFRAVAHRDGGCRYPGCTKRIAWTEAHHITFWRHGGPTSLDNLVLLCSRHHHLIHRPGWHLKLLPDGNVHIATPAGRTHTSQPRPPTHRLQL